MPSDTDTVIRDVLVSDDPISVVSEALLLESPEINTLLDSVELIMVLSAPGESWNIRPASVESI